MTSVPPKHDAVCIVLAAGQGTRMGGPKALMQVGGQPWWQAQRQRLDAAGLGSLWVVSAATASTLKTSGWTEQSTSGTHNLIELPDSPENAPMFASIFRGLSALRTAPPHFVLILPVDVPVPAPGAIAALLGADTSPVKTPTYLGQSGHPVCLAWEWASEKILLADINFKTARLDQLIHGITAAVPVSDPRVCINLNTPRDVEEFLKLEAPE